MKPQYRNFLCLSLLGWLFFFFFVFSTLKVNALECTDKNYLEKRESASVTGNYKDFWHEIDLGNQNCILDKLYQKAMLVIIGHVNEDKCAAVKYLEDALLLNMKNSSNEIVFERNERTFLDLLDVVYSGGYIHLSAAEGNMYSIFLVQKDRVRNLQSGFFSVAAVSKELKKYSEETLSKLLLVVENLDVDVQNEILFLNGILKEEAASIRPASSSSVEIICPPRT
ncbi:hypothetical protein [Roseibium sp. MMSF_3412]|uniref:hypothetical protein n=1 Tax=Roseibium sp. MMSF_3412 TaxID=3046712 RepID=UPI00273D1578|nr:hypothetical protein [Roseibium sp. MMSF_3412]